ncbi:MAG TPA: glycosyltransferase family 2 protein [Thermoanaerobaculia bacterium]|nr:glycosyltransferase family 2 protein [Thermoanaerobaculia bacterium]
MTTPRVSIVLPFGDDAETLPRCLASIRAQKFREFELIAIDDGSGDASAALLLDAGARLLQPGAVGRVAALNYGIASARAPLIARMDADAVMHRERLALQVDWIESGFDLVASQVECAGDPRVRWQNGIVTPADIAANLYAGPPFTDASVLMRKRFVYAHGPFPADYELWLRMHEAGAKMVKIPRVLLRCRTSETNASQDEVDELSARYLARDPRVRYARELVVCGSGSRAATLARRLERERVRIDARISAPSESLAREPRPLVLIVASIPEEREEIAKVLESWGYRAGRDYL